MFSIVDEKIKKEVAEQLIPATVEEISLEEAKQLLRKEERNVEVYGTEKTKMEGLEEKAQIAVNELTEIITEMEAIPETEEEDLEENLPAQEE